MLFCICPDITIQLSFISAWEERGVWEAFHSSAAPLLAQEAFRSEVLAPGTAAAGFPRFMVTGAGDPRVAPVAGKQKQISLHLLLQELEFGCQGSGLPPPG